MIRQTLGRFRKLLFALLVLVPSIAAAHPGHYHPDEEDEFDAMVAGIEHPFTGVDHMLLAVAAGFLAASFVKRERLASGGAFIAAMAGGAAAGRVMQAVPGLELALSATVLGAGAAVLSAKFTNFRLIASMLAVCGFIHGLAHGSESQGGSTFALHLAGILIGSTLLLAAGALLKSATSQVGPWVARIAGTGLLAAGAAFAIQSL